MSEPIRPRRELLEQIRQLQEHIVHSESQRIGGRTPFDNADDTVVRKAFVDRINELEHTVAVGRTQYSELASETMNLRRELEEVHAKHDALLAQVQQSGASETAPAAPPLQQAFGNGSVSYHMYNMAPATATSPASIPTGQPALLAPTPTGPTLASSAAKPKRPRYRDRCPRDARNMKCERAKCNFVHNDQTETFKDVIPTLERYRKKTLAIREKKN
jgi:uncharacterized coiled-coil protein SlyX